MQGLNLEKLKNYLIISILILMLLYFGRTLFIPLSFSILISFLLYPICTWFEKHGIPRSLAVTLCISLLVIAAFLITALLFQQMTSFSHDWGSLKTKLPDAGNELEKFLDESLGISLVIQSKWIALFTSNSGTEIVSFIKGLLYSSGVVIVDVIMIPLFSALILLNRTTLLKVLYGFFQDREHTLIQHILHLVVHTYYNFIKGMALVYLIVGILNSLGLFLLGIPHPILFGFIASILTFIPFVGIIIGSLLPIAVSWLTYNSIWYPLGVVAIFAVVQYLEANLIFPLAVSSQLKISSIATLISIFAGGILWGAAGMILFVPFAAIIKLIADNTPGLKSLSLLLGK